MQIADLPASAVTSSYLYAEQQQNRHMRSLRKTTSRLMCVAICENGRKHMSPLPTTIHPLRSVGRGLWYS